MKRILLSLLLFAVCAFSNAAQELPLDYFIKQGDYLDLQLSPDGKHMAARVGHNGRVYLAILDASTMKVVGGLRPESKDIIHTVTWVNNERLLYEYAEKQSHHDSPSRTGELYAMNIDGSKNMMLYGFRAGDARTGSRISTKESKLASQEVLSLMEDDEDYILIAEHPWTLKGNIYYDTREKAPIISKLNIYTGKKRKIEVLPYKASFALANKKGQVKFMTWQDEQGFGHSAYRDNNDLEWIPLNLAFQIPKGHIAVGVSEDGTSIYLSGRLGDEEVHTYFSLNMETGEYGPIFSDHATDIEYVIKDKNGMPAVGLTYPGKTEFVYADTASKTRKVHKMLASAFEGQTVDITSSTKDGKTLLVHVSSDVNPGEYYLFDADTLGAQFVWANRSWIDPRTLAPMQPIDIKMADGETVHGYLTLPTNLNTEEKPPLVVMIHGGPHQSGTRDYWDYNNETQLLANRGYAVLQVNFRGSDGYGKRFELLGYKEWGGAMIQDINDSVNWVIEQGFVDGEKVCAYGASYGGYAALMSVVRAPQLYRCTVGYVGVYDLNYMFSESDIPSGWGGPAYLERVLGNDKQQLNEYSPIYHADEIKAKVMLIHGSKDRRVPEINAEVLAEKLEAAGNKPIYLQYAQAGHGVYDEKSRMELYQGLLDFLDKNLK